MRLCDCAIERVISRIGGCLGLGVLTGVCQVFWQEKPIASVTLPPPVANEDEDESMIDDPQLTVMQPHPQVIRNFEAKAQQLRTHIVFVLCAVDLCALS